MKLLFTILLSIPFFSFSQNGFSSYGAPAGYTNGQLSNKNAIAIDGNDNKWVAFQRIGVAEYDGTNWTVYNTSNSSLPSDTVNALAVDGQNNIWIGTLRGLAKFDGANWTIFNTSNSGIPDDNITALAVNGNDIWIGTNKGASKYNGSSWALYNTSINAIAGDSVQCFAFNSSSEIFIGTKTGLSRLLSSQTFNFNTNNSGLKSNNISALFYYQGSLWIGTIGGGLHELNTGIIKPTFKEYLASCAIGSQSGSVASIVIGPQGGIMISMFGGGSGTPWDGLYEVLTSMNKIQKYSPTYFITGNSYISKSNASNSYWFVNDNSNMKELYSFDYSSFVQSGTGYLQYNCNDFLDINEVVTQMGTHGDMHWDANTQEEKYEVPKGTGLNAIYTSDIWIGGLDSFNILHWAGTQYAGMTGNNDFWPGPLDTTNGTIDSATSTIYDKIWKVNRYKIEEFKYYFALGQVQSGQYIPDSSIITWPAHGTGNYSRNLAPFIDANLNGIYDPIVGGDYPKIKGDQMLYWMFNDNLASHTGTYGNSLKVEVHASAYAFTCPQIADSMQALNYTTLYNFKIFNRSAFTYDSVYVGCGQDPDLGNYMDDYCGCSPTGNYGYIYNGDSLDDISFRGYGLNPPILSTVILNGPLAYSNDGADNDNDGIVDELGEKNLMTNFLNWYHAGGWNVDDPGPAQDYYNYIRSQWRSGQCAKYGGDGESWFWKDSCIVFMYPDTPTDSSGWSYPTANIPPTQPRYVLGSGPFQFQSGSSIDYDFAIVWSRDTSAPWLSKASFDDNLHDVQKIQQWFAADSFPSCLQINVGVENENQTIKNELTIYPNPANDVLFVSYKPQTKNCRMEIIDLMGRKVSAEKIYASEQQVNISKLPQGIYLLRIKDGDTVLSKKFIKE